VSRFGAILGLLVVACAPAERTPDPSGGDVRPVETTAPAGEYRLDKHHASLIFRVNHLGYSFYTASFSEFDATLRFDPASPETMSVAATIDVGSLVLARPPQDFHEQLMGPDWLQRAQYPEIAYRSTGVALTGPDTARVDGALTLLDVTAPVVLNVTFNGGYPGFHPHDPQARIGFSAYGTLSRSAFGITLGLPPEDSDFGVGDEVAFRIDAEFLGPPTPEDASAGPPDAAPG